MLQYDSHRTGPNAASEGSFQRYLSTVLIPRHGEQLIGMRNLRELRTLALSLDCLLAGRVETTGDILVQRWKAVESAIVYGGWSLARHQELIPPHEVSLTAESERTAATRAELDRTRLEEATRKASERHAPRRDSRPSGG